MQTAEYDPNDFTQAGQREADKGLLVKFFIKARQDMGKSKAQGRPVFKDTEYVDIKIPGNRGSGACRPATMADKQRFAAHYDAFKQRTDTDDTTGTPLIEWPVISRSMAEELSFYHVKTVEQLANMADVQAAKFMGLNAIREQAKKWLKRVKEEEPFLALEARIDKMADENAELRETIKGLLDASDENSELSNSQKKRKVKRAAEKVE